MKSFTLDTRKGFTLVELMLSVGIFVFMTAFLIAKYGTFNGSIITTNTAYDVAITIRQAQSYGIFVRQDVSGGFNKAYGVHFDTSTTDTKSQFILFSDISGENSTPNNFYDANLSEKINGYRIKKNIKIEYVCVIENNEPCENNTPETLSILFKRPNPDAIITAGSDDDTGGLHYRQAEIHLIAGDGTKRKIVVRNNGQISIEK